MEGTTRQRESFIPLADYPGRAARLSVRFEIVIDELGSILAGWIPLAAQHRVAFRRKSGEQKGTTVETTKYVAFEGRTGRWYSRRVPTSFDESTIEQSWEGIFSEVDADTIRDFDTEEEARADASSRQAEESALEAAKTAQR